MKLRILFFIALLGAGLNIDARIPREVENNMKRPLSSQEQQPPAQKAQTNSDSDATSLFPYLTLVLNTINDPYVRGATVIGVILYARYKYHQAQHQHREFEKTEGKAF